MVAMKQAYEVIRAVAPAPTALSVRKPPIFSAGTQIKNHLYIEANTAVVQNWSLMENHA